ncbi:hypothetical protein PUNSTDRAFT_74418 [Punctularia strigosozonata HHB-11173 SS5]|uniref:uncharacterized protein n=1 Tax=Punctularia strigosozonata (strain HHB-11173) TaxID=741275 RepID=UPI0004418708|nr:uncharacterized protein PUNSTDRAFT_74418 [Punctularia strigosozonata HHB-11173 SS5]EIN05501.1 hypothetical protein PUNSTDRAFT_74418 [Punctularia strigosozonata HHB-11173 SS5]
MLWRRLSALTTAALALSESRAGAAPAGFPSSGNGLWFTTPGVAWGREWLPVGNGYLAAMVNGGVAQEAVQLNIESLWSGGPFADPTYNGGNDFPNDTAELSQWMQTYRQEIMQSPTGTIQEISELQTDAGAYGSYAGAGYLLATLDLPSAAYTDYARWLDMDAGVAHSTFTVNGTAFSRQTFCSHPARACVQHLSASSTSKKTKAALPTLTLAWSNYSESDVPLLPNVTCEDDGTLRVRGLVSAPGMLYELLVRVQTAGGSNPTVSCSSVPPGPGQNATITVHGASEAWFTWVGGTNYDFSAGDAAHGFSFAGADPHPALLALLPSPSSSSSSSPSSSFSSALNTHTADFAGSISKFALRLGAGWGASDLGTPTDELRAAYAVDAGNPYLEWLAFNLGRYMLLSSARGSLPANLQGKWANGYASAWSADANINVQMNYWAAEMTNLDVTQSLWDYMEKTWAPRGAYTANVLYNLTGWVTHNEMNIFGHTGMKAGGTGSAQWANYPGERMLHVWDHFDYTHDVAWFRSQGYPLLKGVARFHLGKLIPDAHFNDSTLVVAPCNSPEQLPITLGCAHSQQLIWMLLNAIEKGWPASGDTDAAFLAEVKAKKAQMDKGVHVGSWGQLQEWKVDMDSPTDTHRHLSHLIGLYPGYAVASYADQANYTKDEVIAAATTSLIHRGNGTGPDADAGWEKVWRAAAWAQLGNATGFYHELTYALSEDFGPNLFSLYDPADPDPIFQIDANLGYPAAVLNALIQAPDVPTANATLVVTLLPALPSAWPTGSITGARLRGGITFDFAWSGGKLTHANVTVDGGVTPRNVRIVYGGKTLKSFRTSSGAKVKVL